MKKISKNKSSNIFSFQNKSFYQKRRRIHNDIINFEIKENGFYIKKISKRIYLLNKKKYKSWKDTTKSQRQYLKHKKQNKKEIVLPSRELLKIEQTLLKNDYPIFNKDKYDWRKYWKKSKFYPDRKDFCLGLLSSHKKILKDILKDI